MDTSKLASIAVGIAFAIGVLYNYGYFVSLDLNFFTFLSYKDQLTVLAFFAGPCLLMVVLFGAYRRKMPSLDYVAGFLAIAAIVSWAEGDEVAAIPSLGAFLFWFRGIAALFLVPYLSAVILDFFTRADGPTPGGGKYGLIGLSILGLMVFIVMFGNFRSHIDVASRQFEVEVTLASEDKAAALPRPAHLVRAVDDGMFLILQDAPDRIAFVSKDKVKILSKKVQR